MIATPQTQTAGRIPLNLTADNYREKVFLITRACKTIRFAKFTSKEYFVSPFVLSYYYGIFFLSDYVFLSLYSFIIFVQLNRRQIRQCTTSSMNLHAC